MLRNLWLRKRPGLPPVLLVAAVVAWPPAPAAMTSRQDTNRSVLVTVLDRDGAALRDLTAADFSITDGDEARPVVGAALNDAPLFVALVVDTAQPPGQTRQIIDLREAVQAFVSYLRAASPDGGIALIESAGTGLVRGSFDDPAAALDRRIDRLAPVRQIESSLLEAIAEASALIGEAPSQRRAIVCVDFDSVDPLGVIPEDVATAVEGTGAAFWSISVRTSGNASPRREVLLNYLPPRTGGLRQTSILSRPLPDLLRRLARTLTSQYVVTFRRPARAPVTRVVPGVSRGATVLMSPWVR